VIVEAPCTGLPPARRSRHAARAIPCRSIPPSLKKFLSSIATVASFSHGVILSPVTGSRIVSEWITPSREPSAAYTCVTRACLRACRLLSAGAEL
jgi:hypothetical protein